MMGVVGDDETAAAVAAALRDAGATVRAAGADAVAGGEPSAVVAVGEAALVDLVAAGVDAPVLPVDAGPGLASVDRDGAVAAVEPLLDGRLGTRPHRLLSVEVAGEPVGPALLDAMLVRSEPGRISEYGVAGGGTRSRFRADGVVVATPAGSHGYARSAGGPRLSPETGSVAVVPVAAFGLGTDDWVLDPAAGLRLTVERDEGSVSLLVDGRERRRLAGRTTVSLSPGGTLEAVVLPDG